MSSKEPSTASPTKPSPTANTKPNRLPAPTLFVGPPSRNASQLSVSRQLTDKAPRTSLNRQKTALNRPYSTAESTTNAADDKDGPTTNFTLTKPSEKTIDAKWREMQSTLNEVELTAQSSTHVFGASHAAALDDLRRAQVELARAWGRSNDQQAGQQAAASREVLKELNMNRFHEAEDIASDRAKAAGRRRGDTETSVSTTLSGESVTSEGTVRSGTSQLEDETAQDIRLASERRAANEAYFQKVDEGVKDVVAKLEIVADAMHAVEAETRSLWSGSERSSTEASSKVAAQAGEG